MNTVYIALGSNVGDRRRNLSIARAYVAQRVGKISSLSHIYETEPWGLSDQPDFYNQVIQVNTAETPSHLMEILLQIEAEMGRVRSVKNAARLIDLDILFYGNEQIRENGIVIPHAYIEKRRFVLEPLNELVPEFMHPASGKTVSALLRECADPLRIRKLEDVDDRQARVEN